VWSTSCHFKTCHTTLHNTSSFMSLLECTALDEKDPNISNAWPGIVTTITLYGAIFVGLLLVFECFREGNPNVYATQNQISPDRTASPLRRGCLCWIGSLFQINDDEMLRVAGLDAYTLIRFLRLNLILSSFCLIYTFVILVRTTELITKLLTARN
jgi:hypothetical protein